MKRSTISLQKTKAIHGEYPAREDECEFCCGTGEVLVPAAVYPGEPHRALIDTAPCTQCDEGEEDKL